MFNIDIDYRKSSPVPEVALQVAAVSDTVFDHMFYRGRAQTCYLASLSYVICLYWTVV